MKQADACLVRVDANATLKPVEPAQGPLTGVFPVLRVRSSIGVAPTVQWLSSVESKGKHTPVAQRPDLRFCFSREHVVVLARVDALFELAWVFAFDGDAERGTRSDDLLRGVLQVV
ncbi:hypothetical protein SAMN05443574_1145 [Haloarcula vallismortis]|uniref:Uncharacterized protein n=1 Tax=Haloarcula vallismortis TaxID=28442 RepID=A0A1H2YV57_HALVA|nr:hypothetical protein SAMN05443574_1145 [Haloarcula vallismortis]